MSNYLAIRNGGKTDEQGAERIFAKILSGQGCIGSGDYLATQNGTPNMSVNVAAGDIILTYLTYVFHIWADATNNVAIASNSSGLTRIDAVVAWVDLTVVNSTSSNNPGASKVTVVQGVNGGSAPSDSDIQTGIGAGNPFMRICNVTVASGSISIVNANISDQRTLLPALVYTTSPQTLSGPKTLTSPVINNGVFTGGGALLSKVLHFTRYLDDASGDVPYTGFGFKPSALHITACINGASYGSYAVPRSYSFGYGDANLSSYCIFSGWNGLLALTANIIYIDSDGSHKQIATIKSYDTDGFTLTYTLMGSGQHTLIDFMVIVFK